MYVAAFTRYVVGIIGTAQQSNEKKPTKTAAL